LKHIEPGKRTSKQNQKAKKRNKPEGEAGTSKNAENKVNVGKETEKKKATSWKKRTFRTPTKTQLLRKHTPNEKENRMGGN